MKKAIFLSLTLVLCTSILAFAAERLHVTFDPPLVPGGAKPLDNWMEQGILFTGPYGFSQYDSGVIKRPDNGTAYLTFASGPRQTLIFKCEDSTPFRLISVDLAEYSTLFPQSKKITFIGHKTNGATITRDFTLDGVIDGTGPLVDFETFTFGVEFSNLSYVEIPTTTYCMDNLIIDTTPGFTAVESLDIVGPTEVVEGSLAHYNAVVSYTNGVEVNVTSSSIWTIEPEIHAHIDANGFLSIKDIDNPLVVTIRVAYTEGGVTLQAQEIIQGLPSLTLCVPSQFATIQAAIDAARDGDMVVIAPGTYTDLGNSDIDFKGKAIIVQSENGPENTIIDCNGTAADPHRGFFFHSGEGSRSVISGLTIINGCAPLFRYQAGSQTYNYWAGGAIFCYGSSPTISLCRFDRNHADWFGGAIACWGASPIITECILTNNVANSGGGVYVIGDDNPILSCCIISNNIACGGNIGVGGNCGGGVYCHGRAVLSNCLLFGNSAQAGGAIFVSGDNVTPGNTQILNCTISTNTANWAGAVCCGELSSPAIVNSILWGNQATYGAEIAMSRVDWGSYLSVCYSNVRGGKNGIFEACGIQWGDGNIDTNPCFINPNNDDYRLMQSALCINTGDPNYVPEPNETDLDGLSRIIGGRVDMGAYEFNHIPIADAGPDQTVTSDSNGFAQVTLDGSGSYDEDDQPLTYLWTWTIDGNSYDANGVNPTIELPVGEHTIQLVVNDGIDDSEPNEVIIKVEWQQIKSHLWVAPRVINRDSHQPKILALIHLPPSITRNQIDDTQPLLLSPGQIPAAKQYIIPHYGRHCHRHLSILAFFNKAALMTAVPDNGRIQLQVTGQLKTGQPFFGVDTVMIKGKEKDKDPKPPKH